MDSTLGESKSKNKNTMLKLKAKMERLKKPPSPRDFQYFVKIGLNGTRINPIDLKLDMRSQMRNLLKYLAKQHHIEVFDTQSVMIVPSKLKWSTFGLCAMER
jgi:hypothetical protein